MGYRETYESWLNNPYFDEATRAELRRSLGMRRRLKSAFTWIWSSVLPDCAA